MSSPNAFAPAKPTLNRVVSLPMLVLYGLGVTIGAGIYVLVGTTAGRAGIHAPSAFLLAAIVMAFSAGSFAEFVGRRPESAGEAAYVEDGFRRDWLTLTTGTLVIVAGVIAAAAIAVGCAGYVAEIVPLPLPVLVVIVVVLMGIIAARGVKESIAFAGILTLLEIGGLAVIIWAGLASDPGMIARVGETIPSFGDSVAMSAVLSATLIAFFAFIGFDAMVNLAEETPDPKRTMPLAILISLVLVTLLYVLVVYVAVRSVGHEELAASRAPVGLLFERLTGLPPLSITLIAIVATTNGIIIQIIMAARVVYGLCVRERVRIPWLARIDSRTRTPLNATITVTVVTTVLAISLPLTALAELTSQVTLLVFALVNGSLVLVKLRREPPPEGIFVVPIVIPIIGCLSCLGLMLVPLVLG